MNSDKEKLLKIIDLMEQLDPLIQGFDSLINRVSIAKDSLDTQHKDAYHTLEALDLNGADAMKWFKATKQLARSRREAKNTLELAEELDKTFKEKGKPPMISSVLRKSAYQCENKAKGIAEKAKLNGVSYMQRVKGVDLKTSRTVLKLKEKFNK